MRIIVTGSRDWTDRETIRDELAELPHGSIIIHGGARGADRFAGEVAQTLGMEVVEYPANWRRFGCGAGIIRNAAMLKQCRPDLVLAFHADLMTSKGTRDMVLRALARRRCPPN